MGVIYKLKQEVIDFILSQRQGNPLASCRQLAESATQKFGLHLSKSSVHDVLKESGIVTPRGRKPKDKFEIPKERKRQIQVSLSQVKLLPNPVESQPSPQGVEEHKALVVQSEEQGIKEDVAPQEERSPLPDLGSLTEQPLLEPMVEEPLPVGLSTMNNDDPQPQELAIEDKEISPEYEGAGKIFIKAALWDLGIFSEVNIKEPDWKYYLTYSKGIKVVLENNKNLFIDLSLPLERCIRETVDGLINNVKPFIVNKVSDEILFKSCMEAQKGFKIENISIVGQEDNVLLLFDNIMEVNRKYFSNNRLFVESYERFPINRSKAIFFSQLIGNNEVVNNILNLKGFETTSKDEIVITLLINNSYENKVTLQQAADLLNLMYLYDEQDRLVNVKIEVSSTVEPEAGAG